MADSPQIQVAASQSVVYSGPLPTAAEFAGYDKALPGSAERILAIAEKEVEHRHKNEDKLIEQSIRKSGRGQWLGFIVAVLSIGAVFVSLFLEQPLGSIAPAIVALTGLATVFVGKNHQR
jgi:uncharacterized membrane protein